MGILHIRAFIRGAKLKGKSIHIEKSNIIIGPIFKRSPLHALFFQCYRCIE